MLCKGCGEQLDDLLIVCPYCGKFHIKGLLDNGDSCANVRDSTGNSYSVASFVLALLSFVGLLPFSVGSLVLTSMAIHSGTDRVRLVVASRVLSILNIVAIIMYVIIYPFKLL